MDKIAALEGSHLKKNLPDFHAGDTVRVFVKIAEEDKTRLQAFEGIVIRRRGAGLGETFTVRRISYGEGVERIFPLHSPSIDKVVIVKPGKVKRARLFYLRGRIGKHGRVAAGERSEGAAISEPASSTPVSSPTESSAPSVQPPSPETKAP